MSRNQLDSLLTETLLIARATLGKHGRLYPFALCMRPDEKLAAIMEDPSENPDRDDAISFLEEGLRKCAKQGEYVATAVCYTVALRGTKPDTIAVAAEHAGGGALLAHLPFREAFLAALAFGQITVSAAKATVFASTCQE